MIDFSLSPEDEARRDRIRTWVIDDIVPYEQDHRLGLHGPNDDLRCELVHKARAAGLLTIQAPKASGGWGLSHLEQSIMYEASGWSTLGPVAMNCAAPDEGNMYLLDRIANEEQKEAFLKPVVAGEQRSAFAMTEPDGAGSDPGQLRTTAVFDGNGFRINGRKWLITGANGATTWIIMANLSSNPHLPSGPTLFVASGDSPGIVIERVMRSMDRNYVEGHSVVNFNDLELPGTALLGEAGNALRYAQLRLSSARLTHCARWLGAACRVQSIALSHALNRTAFGKLIGEHQGVSFQLAKNEIAIHQCRLSVMHACWQLDQGRQARHESSITKAFVSEQLFKVADRCVQVLGGIGVTEETPVAMIFRDLRGFRLYDGPTEVHLHAIARRILADASVGATAMRNPR